VSALRAGSVNPTPTFNPGRSQPPSAKARVLRRAATAEIPPAAGLRCPGELRRARVGLDQQPCRRPARTLEGCPFPPRSAPRQPPSQCNVSRPSTSASLPMTTGFCSLNSARQVLTEGGEPCPQARPAASHPRVPVASPGEGDRALFALGRGLLGRIAANLPSSSPRSVASNSRFSRTGASRVSWLACPSPDSYSADSRKNVREPVCSAPRSFGRSCHSCLTDREGSGDRPRVPQFDVRVVPFSAGTFPEQSSITRRIACCGRSSGQYVPPRSTYCAIQAPRRMGSPTSPIRRGSLIGASNSAAGLVIETVCHLMAVRSGPQGLARLPGLAGEVPVRALAVLEA